MLQDLDIRKRLRSYYGNDGRVVGRHRCQSAFATFVDVVGHTIATERLHTQWSRGVVGNEHPKTAGAVCRVGRVVEVVCFDENARFGPDGQRRIGIGPIIIEDVPG